MPADDAFRRAHLVWAVQHILARPGGTVQVQGPYDAVITGRGVSHIVHLLLSVLTAGFWVPIWLLAIVLTKPPVYRISVDAEGRLSVHDATKNVPMRMDRDGALLYDR
jgi:hypothetical protein